MPPTTPFVAGRTEGEYVEIMNNLRLPPPGMIDIAVPANLACGRRDPS